MEQLVNFIIRPPRADYSPKHDLLDEEFMLKGRLFQRKDLEVKNERGLAVQCSHYMPLTHAEGKALPCVIYCHGNSVMEVLNDFNEHGRVVIAAPCCIFVEGIIDGDYPWSPSSHVMPSCGCRADASEAAIILLPSNITVFTLDFSGSGLSEGEHVTLGWNEKEDLKAVVNYLRTDGNVSCIGLWGRSMGAVTSLMYGAEDPSIAGMVLDSPFSNLVDLMMELVDTYKYPLPKFTVKLAIQHMRRVIKKKANFDIMDLDTIQVAKRSFVPALFGHATDDDFIRPHHSDRIFDSYTGDKNIIKFDGDHNSPRPQFYFDSITIFFHNVLKPPKDVYDEYHTMNDYFDEDNWELHDLEYRHNKFTIPSQEPAAGSTADAINHLREKRPMSRTEVPSDVPCQENLPGVKEDQIGFDLHPSSSRLMDCDPSSGSHRPLVPTSVDDKYLEYSIDSFSDMPCTLEDEERMIMEAIMMSLKDFEITNPEDQTPAVNGIEASTSHTACSSTSACSGADEALELASTPLAPHSVSASTENGICTNESSSSVQSISEASSLTQDSDTVAGTRARLVVQKNPTGHILDGLAHRWGNFFRNIG